MAEEDGGSVGSKAEPEQKSALQNLGESFLDGIAMACRCCFATGRGIQHGTQAIAYPVKETLITAYDGTSNYFTPSQSRRQPIKATVPTFTMSSRGTRT
eukprot:TRINITY_DN16886_c0_g2_i1.p1 TRINITY_DN16886_c0_g2~~TRINITY_DN16886_c0_g2_i1.p1  ORF type:complete len:114 (-),score=12.72 TRINITY_DN16886_c0_g2_i1:84-380(-)